MSRVRRALSRVPRAGDRSPTAASQRSRSPADAVWSKWASWAPSSLSASSTAPAASARSVAATTSPGCRHLLGRGPQPGRIRLVDVRASDGEERGVDDQVRSLGVQQAGLLDQFSQRGVVPGSGARPAKHLGPPPGPGGDARDQAGGRRTEAAEGRGREPMAERSQGARLVVHRGQPVTQRPLDAARDAALVVEKRLEAGPGETPNRQVRRGHHRRGPWRVGEECHLPEQLAGPERREGLFATSVAGDGGRGAAGQYRRPALLDHIEAVRLVTLTDDGLARPEVHLLQLPGQPGEVQAPQVGEERGSGQRGRGVGTVGV